MTAAAGTPALRPPASGAVFLEQLRLVGAKLRWDLFALLALLAFVAVQFLLAGRLLLPEPEADGLIVLVAYLFPFAVWRGERLFDDGGFFVQPVDRPRHLLLRIAAGWVWLMGAGLVTVLTIVALAAITGGAFAGEETGTFIAPTGPQPPLPPRMSALPPMVEPWQWLAPFAGVTALYLIGSAFSVGLKHPARWTLGLFVALVGLVVVAPANPLADVALTFTGGALGLETALTGASQLPDGEMGPISRAVAEALADWPAVLRWLTAAGVWIGGGAVLLAAALWRWRER